MHISNSNLYSATYEEQDVLGELYLQILPVYHVHYDPDESY